MIGVHRNIISVLEIGGDISNAVTSVRKDSLIIYIDEEIKV